MSHRPLVFVSGLTVGDYLLWNWSLSSNHEVVALVAGLTLPPLAVASLWLLALSVARLIAGLARGGAARRRASRPAARARSGASARAMGVDEAPASAASSRKLAA